MTPEQVAHYSEEAFKLYIDGSKDCRFNDAVATSLRAALAEQKNEIFKALEAVPFRTAQGAAYVLRADMLKVVE